MGIRNLAIGDWDRLSQSSFDLELNFTAPNGETATIKGIGTSNQITMQTDGQDVIGRNVHISFSENVLLLENANYPIRNADDEVSMHDHLVSFLDSRGTSKNYKIKQVYPDSTVGIISCDCTDYKTHPEDPSNVVISNITAVGFDISWTSNSNSVEDGFLIQISTSSSFTSPIELTTGKNVVTVTFDTGQANTLYYVQVKATGDIDSNYSNAVSETSGSGYDTDAQAWIDNINAQAIIGGVAQLTLSQEQAINTYILSEKANGNFALKYYEAVLAFGESKGIVDYKGRVGVPAGGLTWNEGIGAIFNGVNAQIATGYLLNTTDPGIADNALVSCLISDYNNSTGTSQVAFGASVAGLRVRCPRIETNGTLFFALDSNTGVVRNPNSPVTGESNYTVTNISGTQTDYQDEVSLGSTAGLTWQTNSAEMIIGSRSGIFFFDGTVKATLIAQAVGFDLDGYRTNLNALLAAFAP